MRQLFILLLIFGSAGLKAQQLPLFSEYSNNGFVINPAMMGWEGMTAISASYRHQWTGMPQSPRTATLSFRHMAEDLNMAYGGYFVHDQTGPTSFTGLNFLYAYHLKFKSEEDGTYERNRLSIGLSLSGLGYRLRGADLRYIDPDDELIIQNDESQFYPDAGMGLFYYNDLYYVGFSVPQMIAMRVRFNDDLALSTIRRVAHFYLNAGAKFEVKMDDYNPDRKHHHYILPSFWIKYAPSSPININMNVRYMYDDIFTASLGYSTDGSVISDFSVYFLDNYRLGYAFSMAVNGLAPQLGTNHEIMFTYIFKSSGKGWYVPKVD
jgi:type IX secretion system PorP/SprF family membrane protein